MNAPLNINTMLSTEQSLDVARALYLVLTSLRPNTELLFYRDDDAAPALEIQHADGTTEVVNLDVPAGETLQIIDTTFESGSHAAWRCVDVGLPEPFTDVLLLQVLEGFTAEEGNTLIRIGFLRYDGNFVATYASEPDGSEQVLETITHWAPLPADPVGVRS